MNIPTLLISPLGSNVFQAVNDAAFFIRSSHDIFFKKISLSEGFRIIRKGS